MIEMHVKRNFKKCVPTIKRIEDKFHATLKLIPKFTIGYKDVNLNFTTPNWVKAKVRLVRAHVKGHVATRL